MGAKRAHDQCFRADDLDIEEMLEPTGPAAAAPLSYRYCHQQSASNSARHRTNKAHRYLAQPSHVSCTAYRAIVNQLPAYLEVIIITPNMHKYSRHDRVSAFSNPVT